jgi:hypothetical protein
MSDIRRGPGSAACPGCAAYSWPLPSGPNPTHRGWGPRQGRTPRPAAACPDDASRRIRDGMDRPDGDRGVLPGPGCRANDLRVLTRSAQQPRGEQGESATATALASLRHGGLDGPDTGTRELPDTRTDITDRRAGSGCLYAKAVGILPDHCRFTRERARLMDSPGCRPPLDWLAGLEPASAGGRRRLAVRCRPNGSPRRFAPPAPGRRRRATGDEMGTCGARPSRSCWTCYRGW